MPQTTLLSTLKNIGLTVKQAKVYLATLETGQSPVSMIANKAGINRVTTYDILEKLIQKGFIHFITKNKIKLFSATEPEIITEGFKQKTIELEKILPELEQLGGEKVIPHVRYFEGIEGIKAIYADTLTSKTDILNYANSEEIRIHWPTYDQDYVKKRAKKKIFLYGIAPDDEYGKEVQKKDKESFREIRLVPKADYNFSNEIHIYDHKVAIISMKNELIGMIIESQEIANTQRAIFKMAWEFSELHKPEMTIRKLATRVSDQQISIFQ